MNFKKNDISSLLQFDSSKQKGQYNQLTWVVNAGDGKAADILNRIISAHEFLHNELNNTSTYGFVLQGLAYLSREKIKRRKHFEKILLEMVDLCRTAHEVYATWQGISLFSLKANDKLAKDVLKGNAEYIYYYSIAKDLSANIKSLYLKRNLIVAITNICFQSKAIANAAMDLKKFSTALVRSVEFPTKRLEYIVENYSAEFWENCVKNFVSTQTDAKYHSLLMKALKGTANERAFINDENDIIGDLLIKYIYEIVAEDFKLAGMECMPFKMHMQYFEELLHVLDKIAPFDKSVNPLTISKHPNDVTRLVLQSFENETIQFTQVRTQCTVWLPKEITAERKNEIISGMDNEPHIFITGRHYFSIKNQHTFLHLKDKEWFNQGIDLFTAIRFNSIINGVNTVVYVPFKTPGELQVFLKDKRNDVALVAAISASANKKWWKKWGDFFTETCQSACLLLDVSPLSYIENIFSNNLNVSYGKIDVKFKRTVHSCIYFQVMQNEESIAFMIAPCSEMYYQSMKYFIDSKYPKIINEMKIPKEQLSLISLILSHIYQEEHSFYFRNDQN